MAKRLRLKSASHTDDTLGSDLAHRLNGSWQRTEFASSDELAAQKDQDVEQRRVKNSGGLFEKVLMGRLSLQDAYARGLQLTPQQQQLYKQVRSPSTVFW